jgi:hypothetical protein
MFGYVLPFSIPSRACFRLPRTAYRLADKGQRSSHRYDRITASAAHPNLECKAGLRQGFIPKTDAMLAALR